MIAELLTELHGFDLAFRWPFSIAGEALRMAQQAECTGVEEGPAFA